MIETRMLTVLKSAVESAPEADGLRRDLGPEHVALRRGLVQRVGELVVVGDEVPPERVRLFREPQDLPLPLAVPDEGAVLAAAGA